MNWTHKKEGFFFIVASVPSAFCPADAQVSTLEWFLAALGHAIDELLCLNGLKHL